MRTTKAVNQTRREVILQPAAEVPNRWVKKKVAGNNRVAKQLGSENARSKWRRTARANMQPYSY